MIRHLVVLGASGDLTARYLLPALARLMELGRLPPGFKVTGISRESWEQASFRENMADELRRHAGKVDPGQRQALLAALAYRRADVTEAAQLRSALPERREPWLVYLALPPSVYAPAIRALCEAGLPGGSRLAIEKPFGVDLASAQVLNRLIGERLGEERVFRVDHFLGMPSVQNILGLRFANRLLETLWRATHVERVEILWEETLTLEGRADYYDRHGALHDMIQNHLLQVLCLVGMEAPISLTARSLRGRKLKLLRSVRPLEPEDVARCTVRGRYGAGRIGEREVPAYVQEHGVDPARGTETFAQVALFIDNWRWAGVPFVLRSGKALGRDRREVIVHFRPVRHLAFENNDAVPNRLHIVLDPERIALTLNVTDPDRHFHLAETVLQCDPPAAPMPAYARLLLDALQGDFTLSVRADEAEEAWRIVEPITREWRAGRVPLQEYPAGSDGPTDASKQG